MNSEIEAGFVAWLVAGGITTEIHPSASEGVITARVPIVLVACENVVNIAGGLRQATVDIGIYSPSRVTISTHRALVAQVTAVLQGSTAAMLTAMPSFRGRYLSGSALAVAEKDVVTTLTLTAGFEV